MLVLVLMGISSNEHNFREQSVVMKSVEVMGIHLVVLGSINWHNFPILLISMNTG